MNDLTRQMALLGDLMGVDEHRVEDIRALMIMTKAYNENLMEDEEMINLGEMASIYNFKLGDQDIEVAKNLAILIDPTDALVTFGIDN